MLPDQSVFNCNLKITIPNSLIEVWHIFCFINPIVSQIKNVELKNSLIEVWHTFCFINPTVAQMKNVELKINILNDYIELTFLIQLRLRN